MMEALEERQQAQQAERPTGDEQRQASESETDDEAGLGMVGSSGTSSSADSGCSGGRVRTGGGCCWHGQMWSETRRRCMGTPRSCPSGYVIGPDRCRPKQADLGLQQPQTAQPQRREEPLIAVEEDTSEPSSTSVERQWLSTLAFQFNGSEPYTGYMERYRISHVVLNPGLWLYPFFDDAFAVQFDINLLGQVELDHRFDAHFGIGAGIDFFRHDNLPSTQRSSFANLLVAGVSTPFSPLFRSDQESLALAQLRISRFHSSNFVSIMLGVGTN